MTYLTGLDVDLKKQNKNSQKLVRFLAKDMKIEEKTSRIGCHTLADKGSANNVRMEALPKFLRLMMKRLYHITYTTLCKNVALKVFKNKQELI